MKTNIKNTSKQNWSLPVFALFKEEFEKDVKDAVAGPFYTIEESKKILEGWRKKLLVKIC